MGVSNLWSILSSTCRQVSLASLKNKTLAVDLSIWICENSCLKYNPSCPKPYLRNLFFRTKALVENGCTLVFVKEGDVVALKQNVMKKRNNARFGGDSQSYSQSQPSSSQSQSQKPIVKRSHFDSIANECVDLLKLMGITVIRSPCGEAEKACAFLNAIGRCDGVITNDGDAFLYGARTIYRNFNMDKKDLESIEEYTMDRIEAQLHYDRETLVAFALLLGCDYDDKGIAGVGKELACKFVNEFRDSQLLHSEDEKMTSVLDLFRKWSSESYYTSELKYEEKVRRLVNTMQLGENNSFPNEEIIAEFLEFREPVRQLLSKEKFLKIKKSRPILSSLQEFNQRHQNWTYDYTASKSVQLIIDFENSYAKVNGADRLVKPKEIRRTRRRAFVECYEVVWSKLDSELDADLSDLTEYVTLEPTGTFAKHFPGLVSKFNAEIEQKKTARIKKKRDPVKDAECGDDGVCEDSIMELYENCAAANDQSVIAEPPIQEEEVVAVPPKAPILKPKFQTPLLITKTSGYSQSARKPSETKMSSSASKKKILSKKFQDSMKQLEQANPNSRPSNQREATTEEEEEYLNDILVSFKKIQLGGISKSEAKLASPSKNHQDAKTSQDKENSPVQISKSSSTNDLHSMPFSMRMKRLYNKASIFDE